MSSDLFARSESGIQFRSLVITIFVIFQVIWFCSVILYFLQNDYLPQPFMIDKYDTFMDFYHPLFWSVDSGRYTEWRSVYPPLVFVVLQEIHKIFFNNIRIYDTFYLRSFNIGIIVIYLLFVFSGVLAIIFSKLYKEFSLYEKCAALIFYSLSAPVLFTIERGNLVIACLPFLLLVFTELGWLSALSLAILINIKPYFVILLFGFLICKNYKGFVQSIIFSGTIFLIAGLMIDLNFPLFFKSLLDFSRGDLIFDPNAVLSMDSSLTVFAYAEKWYQEHFPEIFINLALSNLIIYAMQLTNLFLLGLLGCLLVKSSKFLNFDESIAILTIVITSTTFTFGGYSLVIYVCSFPVFYKMRHGGITALLVLCIYLPIDFFTLREGVTFVGHIYSTDLFDYVTEKLGYGALFRPLLNSLILLIITLDLSKRSFTHAKERFILMD